jgi:hypothetical protein
MIAMEIVANSMENLARNAINFTANCPACSLKVLSVPEPL